MTWADFYLICFLVGFGLSFIAAVTGSMHLHLPHLHFHVPDIHMPDGDIGHGGAGEASPFNFGTIAAFMAWFGGTGYLLTRFYSVWFLAALGCATVSGIGGAAMVFWFFAKVLVSKEENLNPADYDMIGVLGKLSLPIREGGTGEMIFSQEGTRRVAGARSDDGRPIAKGAEVVVTRYERGIAYVRRWEELTEAATADAEQHS